MARRTVAPGPVTVYAGGAGDLTPEQEAKIDGAVQAVDLGNSDSAAKQVDLAAEVTARGTAVTAAIATAAAAADTKVAAEAVLRTTADAALSNSLSTAISTETTRAGTAETTLATSITDEATARTTADGLRVLKSSIGAAGADGVANFDDTETKLAAKASLSALPLLVTPSTSSLATAIAGAATAGRNVLFGGGTYTFTGGLTWDTTAHSWYGNADVTLDFTGISTGYAITVQGVGARSSGLNRKPQTHEFANFTLNGPDLDATTVDGFLLTDTNNLSGVNFDKVTTFGFRDAVYYGNNVWCVTWTRSSFGHFHRRGHAFFCATNAGENMRLNDCCIYSASNASANAAGIYTDVNAGYLGINLKNTSFDYCNVVFDHNAGTINMQGGHFEDSNLTASIFLNYTAGKARTILNISGTVFNPAEAAASARDHYIEMRSGSVGGVHLNINGATWRGYDRSTWIFRNLSTSTPALVRIDAPLIDSSVGTNGAVRIAPDTDLITRDDYAASTPTFLATAGLYGGRGRQGTVAYSWDNTVTKNATYSLKAVGDGTTAATGTWETSPVQPGSTLLMTGYYRVDALTAGTSSLQLRWYSADKVMTTVQNLIATLAVTSGWVPYAFVVKVPNWASIADLSRLQNVNLNGTIYISADHVWRIG